MERWFKYWSSQTFKRRALFAAFVMFSMLLDYIFGPSLQAWLKTLPIDTQKDVVISGVLGWFAVALGLGYYLCMRFDDEA